MIYLLILLSLFLVFLIICFVLGLIKHNKVFGSHFYVSSLIKSYTIDDFNMNEVKDSITCENEKIAVFLYSNEHTMSDSIVIFSHGMYSDHRSYMQEIGYLVSKGLLVLGYDALGYGESGVKATKGFGNNIKSLDYVIRYVKTKYPCRKIYLVGHSLGAFSTLSVLKYQNDIQKVCVLAPFVSYYKELKNMTKTQFLSLFVYIIDIFKNGKYACINTKKVLTKYKGKALIISSKDDSIISFSNTRYLMDNFKNFDYITLDAKDHNPDYTIEAVNKLKDFRTKLNTLEGDNLVNYMNGLDFKKLGELDNVVMNKIVDFLNE